LWLMDRASGAARRVSDAVARMAEAREVMRWSTDGAKIFLKVLPGNTTVASARADLARMMGRTSRTRENTEASAVVFHFDPREEAAAPAQQDLSFGAYGATLTADLAAIEVRSGAVERVAPGTTTQWWAPSPTGRHLAFTRMLRYEAANTYQRLFDLVV